MNKITIGWMYPDLLNLHGERGSVQALQRVGANLGMDVEIRKINDFDEDIPYEELDMLVFLPGEIAMFQHLIPALRRKFIRLITYIEEGGYVLALGTTGLLFGKEITREDGSVIEGLGLLDMTATERKYVWGNDLHLRLNDTKQELIGSQIQMADVNAKHPLGQTIYGMGNNNTGAEGARYRNLIYTNCLGPLFVKNPWFAEAILKDICLKKYLGVTQAKAHAIASNSFDSTLKWLGEKPDKA